MAAGDGAVRAAGDRVSRTIVPASRSRVIVRLPSKRGVSIATVRVTGRRRDGRHAQGKAQAKNRNMMVYPLIGGEAAALSLPLTRRGGKSFGRSAARAGPGQGEPSLHPADDRAPLLDAAQAFQADELPLAKPGVALLGRARVALRHGRRGARLLGGRIRRPTARLVVRASNEEAATAAHRYRNRSWPFGGAYRSPLLQQALDPVGARGRRPAARRRSSIRSKRSARGVGKPAARRSATISRACSMRRTTRSWRGGRAAGPRLSEEARWGWNRRRRRRALDGRTRRRARGLRLRRGLADQRQFLRTAATGAAARRRRARRRPRWRRRGQSRAADQQRPAQPAARMARAGTRRHPALRQRQRRGGDTIGEAERHGRRPELGEQRVERTVGRYAAHRSAPSAISPFAASARVNACRARTSSDSSALTPMPSSSAASALGRPS